MTTHAIALRQRGAATLSIALVLLLGVAFGLACAHQAQRLDTRSAANQTRSMQAFEAAEAGIEWATAMLNSSQPVDDDCRPSTSPGALTLRERLLAYDSASRTHTPLTWDDGGRAVPLQPSCQRDGEAWACSCPRSGPPHLAFAGGAGTAPPMFSIALERGPQPGTVRLAAQGCVGLGSPCLPASTARTEASARVQVLLGLVPGIATLPAAPLTVKGDVDAQGSALGLHNPDAASGGAAVDAGGSVAALNLRLTTAPGAAGALAVIERDAALRDQAADRLFARHFGLDKATWRDQPAVDALRCADGCAAELERSTGRRGSRALIWIEGDALIEGPATIGSADRPVVLVADGTLRLRGAVVVHGLIHARHIGWDDTSGAGALLRGAAISETGYRGNGAPDLFYDARVLGLLNGNSGSFVRVPGSWRDF
jgi:hypothetical protein